VNTLITIPFSHFCEKARWALDWCGVPYVERGFLPGLHLTQTRRIGGRTVPALMRADGGAALTDSTAILQWADAQAPAERRLYPVEAAARAEADAFEEYLDEKLGPATRLWVYAHGLRDKPLLRAAVAPSFPRWRDRALLALLLPVVGKLIEQQYGATPDAAARAEVVILDGFARISARLESQPWLSGARFGASDLTFAALGGAIVRPPELRTLRHDLPLPPPMRAFIDRLRATPAGAHALRCYREHRHAGKQHSPANS
jgi:glutathione S-transferase